jgi:hypothetical protein
MSAKSVQPSNLDFTIVEYQEAAAQYRAGVDLGVTSLKALVTLNSVLLAAVAALTQVKVALVNAEYIVYVAAAFGIIISGFTFAVYPYYEKQLENCSGRCAEIEALLGGRLYTNVSGLSNKRSIMRSIGGIGVICIFFVAVWCVVGYGTLVNPTLFSSVAP